MRNNIYKMIKLIIGIKIADVVQIGKCKMLCLHSVCERVIKGITIRNQVREVPGVMTHL